MVVRCGLSALRLPAGLCGLDALLPVGEREARSKSGEMADGRVPERTVREWADQDPWPSCEDSRKASDKAPGGLGE